MTLAVHTAGQIRNVYGPNFKATSADAEIDKIIGWLEWWKSRHPNRPLRILVYAHGGMVSQEGAVADAETLAPPMIADGYTPIFLVWNSDLVTSYIDRLCCVLDGEQRPPSAPFIPLRLFSDLGSGVARTPEALLKQVIRWRRADLEHDDAHYFLDPFDSDRGDISVLESEGAPGTGCSLHQSSAAGKTSSEAAIIFPPFCGNGPDGINSRRFNFNVPALSYYTLGLLVRPFSTTAIGVGTSSWENMVRRTRLAFRAPCPPSRPVRQNWGIEEGRISSSS